MKRFRNWRYVALIAALACLVFGGWYFSAQAVKSAYPQAWSDWRDKVQDAVTEYSNANNGSLPVIGGGAVIVDGEQQGVIDTCALVEAKLLPSSPASCISLPGAGDDNCDGGGCSCTAEHHYLWTVDPDGTVGSVCIGETCDRISADGYQGVWP